MKEKVKEKMIFSKNCLRTPNPPDELVQNVSKKITLFLHFSSKVQNLTVFSIIHMIRIRCFGPRELIQRFFFGRTVMFRRSADHASVPGVLSEYLANTREWRPAAVTGQDDPMDADRITAKARRRGENGKDTGSKGSDPRHKGRALPETVVREPEETENGASCFTEPEDKLFEDAWRDWIKNSWTPPWSALKCAST